MTSEAGTKEQERSMLLYTSIRELCDIILATGHPVSSVVGATSMAITDIVYATDDPAAALAACIDMMTGDLALLLTIEESMAS